MKMLTLNEKLYDIYMTFKDKKNPPVPLETIEEYLKLEKVSLEDEDKSKGDLN